jgi:ATP-dependent DNA helicase RecQ
LARHIGAKEFEVGAAIRILERGGFLSRGGRGDGVWLFKLAPEAQTHSSPNASINAVMTALRGLSSASNEFSLNLQTLEEQSGVSGGRLRQALSQLEKGRFLSIQKPYAGKAIRMKSQARFDQLGIDVVQIRAQERRALRLLRRMTDYAYTRHCRRAFLLRYFGEVPPRVRCKACDICARTQSRLLPRTPTHSAGEPELSFSALAFEELQRWRRSLSGSLKMPAYLIFSDKTLKAFAAVLPTSREEFLTIKGTGPTRWERFGVKVTSVSAMARAAGEIPRHAEALLKKRASSPRRSVARRIPAAPSVMELQS